MASSSLDSFRGFIRRTPVIRGLSPIQELPWAPRDHREEAGVLRCEENFLQCKLDFGLRGPRANLTNGNGLVRERCQSLGHKLTRCVYQVGPACLRLCWNLGEMFGDLDWSRLEIMGCDVLIVSNCVFSFPSLRFNN